MLGTICVLRGQAAIVVKDTIYEKNDQGAVALYDAKGREAPDGSPRPTGKVRVVVLAEDFGEEVDPSELEPCAGGVGAPGVTLEQLQAVSNQLQGQTQVIASVISRIAALEAARAPAPAAAATPSSPAAPTT